MRFAVWPARRAKEEAMVADGLGGDRDDGTKAPPYHLNSICGDVDNGGRTRSSISSASAKTMLTSLKCDWLMPTGKC